MGARNNFDGLRLFGAVLVLWSHMFPLSGRPEPEVLNGHIGVLVFFSISGYLISKSWRRDPRLVAFATKRFLRVAPGVTVAIVLAWSVVSLLGMHGFPGNPIPHLNGSLWTIPMEVACYAILAVIAWKVPRVGLPLALIMLLWWQAVHVSATRSTIGHFGMFFAFGVLLDEYPVLRRPVFTGAFVAAGVAYAMHGDGHLARLMIVAPLTVFIGEQSWPLLRDAGRFGDLSYGIYIYAWPVQQLTVAALPNAPYLVLLSIALVITAALAWLSWHYVESPCLRFKPSPGRGERLADLSEVNVASARSGS